MVFLKKPIIYLSINHLLFISGIVQLFALNSSIACHSRQDCHFHGDCLNGGCQCDPYWTGDSCDSANCVFGTIGQNGKCKCDFSSNLVNGVCIKNCQHGVFLNTTDKCQCNENWETAGITDTIDWFKGTCSQFQCKSTQQCVSLLAEIDTPTCPIHGWNCDCGFSHLGHSNENAGCMSFTYLFSIRAFLLYKYLCINVFWKICLILFTISLPFGRRRPHCDHHRSWMAALKRTVGIANTCQGECVYKVRWCLRDDLALSLYWLKSTIWWYGLATSIILMLGYSWSLILWVAVLLMMIGVGCMMLCAACAGGGNGGGGDCSDCSDCGVCCCDDCCCLQTHGTMGGNSYTTNIIYIGGPYPGNSGCFDCCYGNSSYYSTRHSTTRHSTTRHSTHNTPSTNLIDRSNANDNTNRNNKNCCCWCFRPLYYLWKMYPIFPENLQGGVIGYLMGTHITNSTYRGRNRFIDFMSLRQFRRNDLRNNMEWQETVSKHLQNYSPPPTPLVPEMVSLSNLYLTKNNVKSSQSDNLMTPTTRQITNIKGVYINNYNYSILNIDHIVNKIHLEENECWICNEEPIKWHIWKSCNHAFCENCSTQMLERKMTCPLCRNAPIGIDSYQNMI